MARERANGTRVGFVDAAMERNNATNGRLRDLADLLEIFQRRGVSRIS